MARNTKRVKDSSASAEIMKQIEDTLGLVSSLQGVIRAGGPEVNAKLLGTVSKVISDLVRAKISYEEKMANEAAAFNQAQKEEALIEWLLSLTPNRRARFLTKLSSAEETGTIPVFEGEDGYE